MSRIAFLIVYFGFIGLVGYSVYKKIVDGGPPFEVNFKTMEDMSNGNFKISSP